MSKDLTRSPVVRVLGPRATGEAEDAMIPAAAVNRPATGFHGRRLRSARSGARVISLLLALGLSAHRADAVSVEEDDEETLGGDPAFSVPTDIADAKRELAAVTGFSALLGASAFIGSDDNVYRSPADARRNSTARGSWGYLRTDARWREVNRLLSTLTWRGTQYPGHGIVDVTYAHLSNWYTRPLGPKGLLEVDFDASNKSDDAATIHGAKYSRRYANWRYAGETAVSWEPRNHQRVRLAAEAVVKNYEETPNESSIDWRQWLATMSYRLNLTSAHYADLSYAVGQRHYTKELASLSTGAELGDNPTEKHRYRELTLTTSSTLGGRLKVELHYDRSAKDDLFQGYESRRTQGVQAAVGLLAFRGLEFQADGRHSWREYDRMEGDSGRRLSYTSDEIGFNLRCHLVGGLNAFSSVGRYRRNTNKTTGSSYRDYSGTRAQMGMSLFL